VHTSQPGPTTCELAATTRYAPSTLVRVGDRAQTSGPGDDHVSGLPLPGGFVNEVVRVGDTVRRPAPWAAGFIRHLLRHFERHRWPGAPRFLGIDEQGREVLSFIDGHVAWQRVQPPQVYSEASLIRVAQLVRQFHDLTAGTDLAGDEEVVCHNDLSPKNTVYRDTGAGLRPMAFIDWDIAAPGQRIHDVAHVCWQYLNLGPTVTDTAEAARLVRVIADAYGMTDRSGLVDTILWWQDRCWRGIEAEADGGDPATIRMRDLGIPHEVRESYRWTAENRPTLQQALT